MANTTLTASIKYNGEMVPVANSSIAVGTVIPFAGGEVPFLQDS